MPRNLIIRGFDDDIHSQLGDLSRQKGVSINSIVKDAVDKWLKQQKEIPKRHHLLIYEDEKSLKDLLKSIDELAKKGNWFRCFIRSSESSIADLLKKLNWFDSSTEPLQIFTEGFNEILYQVIQNILQNSNNKEICCVDFLINDIAKSSIKDAINIEKAYNENKLQGLVFCVYKTNNLLNSSIPDIIETFNLHEQIFIIKDEQVYKLHITRENIINYF